MPQFHCSHCHQLIDAGDEFAGMAATCPTCGKPVTVPQLQRGPAVVPQRRPPAVVPWVGVVSAPEPMPESPPAPATERRIVTKYASGSTPQAAPAVAPESSTGSGNAEAAPEIALPPIVSTRENGSMGKWPLLIVVLVAAIGVGSYFAWGFAKRPSGDRNKPIEEAGKGKQGTAGADDGAASASSSIPQPPPDSIPDAQLNVPQLSERQLAKGIATLKLSKDEAAAFTGMWRQSFAQMFNVLLDATDHINDDGVDQLFEPERLLHDKDFTESARLLGLLNKRNNVLTLRLNRLGNEFAEGLVDSIPRLKLYTLATPEPGSAMAPLLAQVTAAINQQHRMIDYLKSTFGRWQVKDGHFDFQRESEGKAYEKLLEELAKISAEMDRLQGTPPDAGK